MKIVLTVLFILIPLLSKNATTEMRIYTFVYPHSYLDSLHHFSKEICDKYQIDYLLCVSQAIVEMGYKRPNNNRIFNIMTSSENHELVFDDNTWKKYKTYNDFEDAIEDYASLISRKYYQNEPCYDTRLKSLTKYATDKRYLNKVDYIYQKQKDYQVRYDTIKEIVYYGF